MDSINNNTDRPRVLTFRKVNRYRKHPVLITGLFLLIVTACGAKDTEPITPPMPASESVIESPTPLLAVENSLLVPSDMFTSRDLQQTPDLEKAVLLNMESGTDTLIDQGGIYLLTGKYHDATVIVEADNDNGKVQLILNDLTITNTQSPVIYVKSADKVFISTLNSRNSLSVTGAYTPDGERKPDAVIFSRSDLTLNGKGTLIISSAEGNGISSKDDLKITGGSLDINSKLDGLEANDSIRIAAGLLSIKAGQDALHSENNDDPALGFIYIHSGELSLTAGDDAIRANSFIQIDGGRINVRESYEGLEATHIRISGGILDIYSSDDGINVTAKTPADVLLEIYGGDITIEVGKGDTDAFDANGDMSLYGGIIRIITSRSAFDIDGTLKYFGGIVSINGETVSQIPVTSRGPGSRVLVDKSSE